MAGLRIPGWVGGSFSVGIDSGTMARVLSLPPGPMRGVDDWARDQLRRAAREGTRLAGQFAYDLIMREIEALQNDMEAKMRLIASLPADVRKRVAYETFAAGFSHYLPKKLLRQYVWGEGADYKLPLQEMIDCNPHINLQRSKAFRDLVDAASQQPGKPFPFELPILSGALTNGTLGQFTVKTKGVLVADASGGWQASGSMTFYDEWDFDPKDFTTGGRTLQGELKTRFANAWLPGRGFKIYSAATAFSQSQADTSAVWAGGPPKAEPDRIAALDVELSKPDK
jgi:hypothetical protein